MSGTISGLNIMKLIYDLSLLSAVTSATIADTYAGIPGLY